MGDYFPAPPSTPSWCTESQLGFSRGGWGTKTACLELKGGLFGRSLIRLWARTFAELGGILAVSDSHDSCH